MDLTRARALIPNAIVKEFTPATEIDALESLALWGLTISPLVTADRSYIDERICNNDTIREELYTGITIDITGTDKLHKGEANLVRKLLFELLAKQLAPFIAISSTAALSWACLLYTSDAADDA